MVSRTPEPPCGGRGASFIASCRLRHDTAKAARQRYDSSTTDELLGRNSSLVRLCGPPSQFEITRARPIDTNLSTAQLPTGPSPSHIHSEYPGSLGTSQPSGNTIGGPFASRSTCSRTKRSGSLSIRARSSGAACGRTPATTPAAEHAHNRTDTAHRAKRASSRRSAELRHQVQHANHDCREDDQDRLDLAQLALTCLHHQPPLAPTHAARDR